jgi:ubiquinone/menaquinone biosynthesis C-methylase UbiE
VRRQLRQFALKTLEVCNAAAGRPWRKFYAFMLNRDERKTTMKGILAQPRSRSGKGGTLYDVKRGEYHAEYLKRHGLQPTHRILDFGCGYGRTAIPLLRYLEPGNYVGVELSAARARLAREFVEIEKLEDRRPKFIVSDDTHLRYLNDKSIDAFWAQSVFTHMPEDDSAEVLKALHRVLKPDGFAILDYDTTTKSEIEKLNIKGFYYPERVFAGIVRNAGFDFEVLRDWEDDLPSELRHTSIRSLKLRPRAGS